MTEHQPETQTQDNERLRRLMERELRESREALTATAARNAETTAEIHALALRLTAKEAEYEAAHRDAVALRGELAEARERVTAMEGELGRTEAQIQKLLAAAAEREVRPVKPPGLMERGVRKAKRVAGRASRGSNA